MQKQDGCKQVKRKGKSCLQETIILDETVQDKERETVEKAAPKLVGNILHLHRRNWLKINWRTAGYLFYLISKKLN